MKVNDATVHTVKAYLEYFQMLLRTVTEGKSYSTPFKEIDDDLIIQPGELIDLLNEVHKALSFTND